MKRSISVVLATLLLTVGCGGGGGQAEENTATESVAGAPTLRGMVGTEESPDAFEITLVDEDGNVVTTLPAGEYNIEVTDRTSVHNFHLSGGDGAVDEKTTPTEKIETTWVVTFKPGEYRYLCDPHPSMQGHFTVN